MEKIYQANKDKAEFVLVYIKEAHPEDGWKVRQNEKAGIKIDQPKTWESRGAVATTCATKLELSIPVVVDEIDNKTGMAYAGWPDRLYIVGSDGKIAYKGGPGPGGFKAQELAEKLDALLKTEKK